MVIRATKQLGPPPTTGSLAVLLLLLLVPGVSGWAQPAVPGPAVPAAPMPADWAVFAGKGCARCHRVQGIGDGDVGPDLGRLASGTSFFDIAAAMWNHLPRMRVAMLEQGADWPQFTPQELSNLIAFLFTAQDRDARGNPGSGGRLFVSRGCERCHAAESQGRPLGPSLDGLKRSISPVLMVATMWNHGSRLDQAMQAAGVARLNLAGTDLLDILAYIESAGAGPREETTPTVVGIAERGRHLFTDKGCGRCHAVSGQGAGPGPSLGPRAARPSLVELAGRMSKHGPAVRSDVATLGIPPPRLTGPEAADIVAYLHASYYFDAEGDRRRGRRLLQDKGCLRCHSIYRKGGGLAPDLATGNVTGTQTGQLAAMWSHGRQMENKSRREAIPLPTLTGRELSDITRFLAGLGSAVPAPR
jgi:mono/diheme cytochrome c family protein